MSRSIILAKHDVSDIGRYDKIESSGFPGLGKGTTYDIFQSSGT